jgi:NAD(P)H-hydrate epimerase
VRLFTDNLALLAVESRVVREMDRRAIDEFRMPGAVLMENAGAAAADVAADMVRAGDTVLVMAGSGNNAGDGFVIARHLVNRGLQVEVATAVADEGYKGDAALNYWIIEKMRVPMRLWQSPAGGGKAYGLIVDALLGTGLSGTLRAPYVEMIDFINGTGTPVLAVDIPSGLDGDDGAVHGAAVKATTTVTFALPKKGLFIGQGPSHAGDVILADIGMPSNVYPPGKALPRS